MDRDVIKELQRALRGIRQKLPQYELPSVARGGSNLADDVGRAEGPGAPLPGEPPAKEPSGREPEPEKSDPMLPFPAGVGILAAAPVVVIEPKEPDSALGIPEPVMVSAPDEPWRSRMQESLGGQR